MMTTKRDNYPWWANLLIDSIKSFGVTTVIVGVLLYVTIKVLIPEMVGIANRYCNAVEQSQRQMTETQQTLAEAQKQELANQDRIVETQEQLVTVVQDVSQAAKEIIAVESESKDFMKVVKEQHDQQLQKLETIETAVVK
jgi:septal ring factor EnvC (AmiA/AmiB activator)